jgi:hypothetical protein
MAAVTIAELKESEVVALRAKFMARITPDPKSGCWLWTGYSDGNGYGRLRVNHRIYAAHRLSIELHVGPIPQGNGMRDFCACHRCDNPPCVNPAHLYVGSHADNVRDANAKGRAVQPNVAGARNGRCKLDDACVAAIRNTHASGIPTHMLAKWFSINPSHVRRIVARSQRDDA